MTPEEWFHSIPPITKGIFITTLVLTICSTFSIISTKFLYFSSTEILTKFHIWRLVFPFLFHGNFSMPFIFQLYMLVNYTRSLEDSYFRGARGKVDMFAMFGYIVTSCFILDFFFNMGLYFPAPIFLCAIIYIWSRKDPVAGVSMYGFSLKAWHIPYVMILFSLLMGGNVIYDIIGILIGHVYHFVVDIVPKRYHRQIYTMPEMFYVFAEKLGDKIEKREGVAAAFVSTAASTAPPFARRVGGRRLGE